MKVFTWITWIMVGLLWLAPFGVARGETSVKDESFPLFGKSAEPYCGLYCMYTALRYEGKSVAFHNLIKPEYLGSTKGSSVGSW